MGSLNNVFSALVRKDVIWKGLPKVRTLGLYLTLEFSPLNLNMGF